MSNEHSERQHSERLHGERHREKGTVLMLSAIAMMVLLIMAAFSVDVGNWYNVANRSQRAADLAALAAVEELVRVEAASGDRAMAEAAARALVEQLALENGFDPNDPDITVTVSFSVDAFGADVVNVVISEGDVELFFAGLVIDDIEIGRQASSSLNDCEAQCDTTILIGSGLAAMVDAGTGGDGWEPTLAGDQIFNLFHHGSGDVLQCVDKATEATCEVGGSGSYYPLEPYSGIKTNYTPKLAAINDKAYFVVQTSTEVGLGCWDGATHLACSGFSSPVLLESYQPNGGNTASTRIDGPEVVGNRLFMYGDNNLIYCINATTAAACSGYPKASALSGAYDLAVGGGGLAGGVSVDELQFDMEPTISGDKIFTSLTPVPGSPDQTVVGCWDTTTDAPCSGFGPAVTDAGHPFLFLSYSTSNVLSGVCARAGDKGGADTGHQCFNLAGNPVTSPIGLTFDRADGKPTQQSATGETTWGAYRTYFPLRSDSASRCWDWTAAAVCANAPSNWSSNGTQDYGYIYDGVRCMYGLGHAGLLWTFDIDTGQWPCPSDGGGTATIYPCSCADGVEVRWTALVVTADTDLPLFDEFIVTVLYPDGTEFASVDLTTVTLPTIDLRPLNDISPFPTQMTVSIEATVVPGMEAVALADGLDVGLSQLPGRLPTLIE